MTIVWIFMLMTAQGQVLGARSTWEACESARLEQIRLHRAAEVAVLQTSECRTLALADLR